MAFSFLPKEDEYFAMFSQMTEKMKEGAHILADMLEGPAQRPIPPVVKTLQVDLVGDDPGPEKVQRFSGGVPVRHKRARQPGSRISAQASAATLG